jgi:hypothetical protein
MENVVAGIDYYHVHIDDMEHSPHCGSLTLYSSAQYFAILEIMASQSIL